MPTSLIDSDGTDQFPISTKTQGEIGHLNRPKSITEIDSIMNDLPEPKASVSGGFAGEFYQTLKKKRY